MSREAWSIWWNTTWPSPWVAVILTAAVVAVLPVAVWSMFG